MNNTWKKVGLTLVGLGIVMLGKSSVQAAASADISVVVQVQVVSVSVATTTWSLSNEMGAIVPGSVHVSSGIAVTNDANVQEDYRLSLAENGGWAPSADVTAGSDEFALLALFTNAAASSLNDGSFNDLANATDDLITTSAQAATADLFAINGDAVGVKGFDVAALATRNLYLDFRAPTSNTVTATQYITVTVSAIAG
jgi:hypothetical protein